MALSVPAKLLEKYRYTLSDEEMSDFEQYTQFVELATRLRNKHYMFETKNLMHCDSEEQLAERFVRSKRATIEEITKQRRELGL